MEEEIKTKVQVQKKVTEKTDNLTALFLFKSKARKWRNVALIMIAILFALVSHSAQQNGIEGAKLESASNQPFVGRITIDGVIFHDPYTLKVLDSIAKKESIKALVIHINSPGGTVAGSENLYMYLRKIAKVKPIVVVMDEVAASGGYMSALAADHIIARNGTLTGSIGVLMQMRDLTGLSEKIGVNQISYRSGAMKGQPNPFEKPSPAVNKMIQDSIMDTYDFFAELVAERRGMDLNRVKILADGRPYTGRQAIKNGLIDQIGGEDEALAYLQDTTEYDLSKLKIVDILITEDEPLNMIERFTGLLRFPSSHSELNGFISIWGR